MSTNNQRGGIMILVLILVVLLAIVMPAWLSFVALQKRVISDQEQEERSFQISEAGVQYVISLLNNYACSVNELTANSPIIQTVQDADNGTDIGRYEITLTANGDEINLQSRGYSFGKPKRCQALSAVLMPAWSSVTTGYYKYYVGRQDNVQQANCATTVPAVTTPTCAGI